MHDTSMENYFLDSLYQYMKRLEKEIEELKKDKAGMQRFINNQASLLDVMFEAEDEAEQEILALQIQAAESEHRADTEKRGRLQLVMRR